MAGGGPDRSGDAAEVDAVVQGGNQTSGYDRGPHQNFDKAGLPGLNRRSGGGAFVRAGAGGGDVQSIIGSLASKGISRKARYKITMSSPAGGGGRDLSMRCESISMPGANVRSVPDSLRFGPEREQAQGMTYGPISATFISDRLQSEKAFFEKWQYNVVDFNTWEPKYYNDYKGTVKIFNLDQSNNTTYGVELFEAYPKMINAQDWGHANANAYQTITVEFTFHHWFPTMHGSSAGGTFPGGMGLGINFSLALQHGGLSIEAMLNLAGGGKPTLNATAGISSLIAKAQVTAGVEAAKGKVARPTINTSVVQNRNQQHRQERPKRTGFMKMTSIDG